MRNARSITIVLFICWNLWCAATAVAVVSGTGIQWEEVSSDIKERDLLRVAVAPDDPGTVVVASEKTVYQTENSGADWKEILSLRATGNAMNTICIPNRQPRTVYAGTEDGLLRSRGGGTWKKIYSGVGTEDSAVLSVAVSMGETERIVIGTEAGVFVSDDDGRNWRKGQNLPSSGAITYIAIDSSDHSIMYAVSNKGVHKSLNGGSGWRRILDTYGTDDSDEENAVVSGDDPEYDYAAGRERAVSTVVIHPLNSEILYTATSEGLRISSDGGGTWKRTGSLGLGSLDLRHILIDGSNGVHTYAATPKGVFMYSEETDIWRQLYKGLLTPDIRYLALAQDRNERGKTLWAVTKKGVYRAMVEQENSGDLLKVDRSGQGHDQRPDMLAVFAHEPTIGEVREAAIRYAEVQPEKIEKWRKAAAARAWLPDLKVEYGKGKDWQSSTYFYSTSSEKYTDDDITEGKDRAWSISLNWELGDLIWNSAQTSIDTRSRLVVQLRDDVLSEVTRLYFERRRLVVEMLMTPAENTADKIEKELRLQELTAGLDAMTGAYFSKRLKQGSGN